MCVKFKNKIKLKKKKKKKKMCVYRMEYYLSTKKNEILPFTVT